MKNLGDLGDLIFFLSQNRIQGRVGNSSTLTSWISVDCDRLNKGFQGKWLSLRSCA